jgi:hypothetical protein
MQELIKKLEEQYGKPISEFTEFDWERTSRYPNLSEDFIREYQDKVCWDYISWFQELSEDFIREFQHKVNWFKISIHQKLSDDFKKEFQHKIK